ncbi:MAG TPA: GAF domain-containing protein [Chitinivibrionales bacterium]
MRQQTKHHTIAIVGINRESAAVLLTLIESQSARVVRILNDETEDLGDLKNYPHVDMIINTTNDVEVYQKLKNLNLHHADILSGLSARILFTTGRRGLIGANMNEDKSKLLGSLHEIREAIYLSKNKEELLKLVLNVAIRSSMADSGSIMLLDTRKRTLKIEIAEGLEPSIVAATRQKVGKGIAGTVAKTGKPLLIKGRADRDLYASEADRGDVVSAICAPLLIGREIVGVLSINSKAADREFSEPDLRYVQNLADFTADIIKTSKEYENIASSSFSLTLLNTVRDILALKYSFEERLNLLLLKLANTLRGEICNYYEFSPYKKVFLAKASSSFNIKLIKGKKLKLNDYFSKEVVATGTTVLQSIAEKDGYNKKWYIAQPIFTGDVLTGMLFLHLISPKDHMKEETGVLKKIAEMIGNELGKHEEMESMRVQSIKFSAISEVSFDLATARTINELANIIISNACIILEAESSILRLYNQHTGTLDVLDSFSLQSFSHVKELEAVDQRISSDVISKKETLLIKEIAKTPYAREDIDAKSVLCMYLERGGRLLGTLSLYDKKSLDLFTTRCFSHKDKEIFLNFCLQVSKALDRFILSDSP